MYELNKKRYEVLDDYIAKVPFNMMMAQSVLLGHTNGKVFVDSRENPQSFYIIHSYGMSYLCGESSNEEFNRALFEYFKGTCMTHVRKKDEWLQAFPREWDNILSKLCQEGAAIQYSRLNFKFDADRFYEKHDEVSKSINDANHCVCSMPVEMLFDINGSVVPKDYWKTPEQFASMAKAFSVMIDGKPVSTAFCSARHDDRFEIGIETHPDYQGKGLAYLACAKLIEYCIENKLEPVWSCRLENTGSVKLAEKLGFAEILRMPYYYIPL